MLIEVKVRISQTVDGKTRKFTSTYVLNKDFFSEAEYTVTAMLGGDDTVADFEIQSLKLSSIKEVADQYEGTHNYVVTLRDIFTDDAGDEKSLRYNVLLWADSLEGAAANARNLQRQGYDMLIEGVKEADYYYLSY